MSGKILPLPAFADGSIGFKEDLLPLFRNKPTLERFVLATFTITGAPEGTRISTDAIPALAGTRIGPYSVPVTWQDHGYPVAATLTIYTTQQFYDKHGAALESDLRTAVRVAEQVDSIDVEPLPASDRDIPP
ncbi:hypothetical protein [Burkholderia sp. IMCC1007]|uniref:hypothetical protein n=1 Tax=Burkholderia sp. IMCC1007 TaxID=3004104 RepID=UPI0022B3BCA1|nr:hypothetical protein [Burkholderia sp. IMCC1007]